MHIQPDFEKPVNELLKIVL